LLKGGINSQGAGGGSVCSQEEVEVARFVAVVFFLLKVKGLVGEPTSLCVVKPIQL
jgi:hypothetical protein